MTSDRALACLEEKMMTRALEDKERLRCVLRETRQQVACRLLALIRGHVRALDGRRLCLLWVRHVRTMVQVGKQCAERMRYHRDIKVATEGRIRAEAQAAAAVAIKNSQPARLKTESEGSEAATVLNAAASETAPTVTVASKHSEPTRVGSADVMC